MRINGFNRSWTKTISIFKGFTIHTNRPPSVPGFLPILPIVLTGMYSPAIPLRGQCLTDNTNVTIIFFQLLQLATPVESSKSKLPTKFIYLPTLCVKEVARL